MSDIVVSGLSKAYEENLLFENLSFTLKQGERYCVIGPSGVGKTTLFHILMGLIAADSGTIRGMQGQVVSPVFQENRLCQNLSVASNLRLVLDQRPDDSVLTEGLAELGLMPSVLYQPAKELSGGMQRRISLLRALLHRGDFLLMDEPFRGLDEKTKIKTMESVRQHTDGKTMLWITHDFSELAYLPSHILTLKDAVQ